MKSVLIGISEVRIEDFPVDVRNDLQKIICCANEFTHNRHDKGRVEKICKEILSLAKTRELSSYPLSRDFDISEQDYRKYKEFINDLWELMIKMQKLGYIDHFVRKIETEERTVQNGINEPKSSDRKKRQKTPISYGEIKQNNKELLELIGGLNVLEGYDGDEEMTMTELIKSHLFIRVLNANNNSVEIDGYVSDIVERMARGRCCYYLAITSKLGRGKTVFISKLVNHICELYRSKILLIFISNNTNMQTERNRRIWNCFLSMELSRKRKIWIIIDGLDEIVKGNKVFINIPRLKKAVDYYGAKVIIACRDTYHNQIYREKKEILFNDRIKIYDNKGELFEEIENLKDNIDVSWELMSRALEIPLYATRIRIAFQAWCEADEEERAEMLLMRNDYTFMEFLVNNTLVREKQNCGSDIARYRKALYRIALMIKKFGGAVSVKACIDKGDDIDAELIGSDLIQNFVRIKDDYIDAGESVIQGFVIQNFEEYFFASGLCRALKDKETLVRKGWIEGYDLSGSFDEEVFLAGWNEMGGDQKKCALRTLEGALGNLALKENVKKILEIISK